MEVTEEKRDQTLILTLKGRVDNFCSAILLEELQTIINTGIFFPIINLAETTYLSASCIRVFIQAHLRVEKFSGKICLTALSPAAQKIITFTRSDKVLATYPTNEAALEDIKPCGA